MLNELHACGTGAGSNLQRLCVAIELLLSALHVVHLWHSALQNHYGDSVFKASDELIAVGRSLPLGTVC
jgi:hypothetical protein